MISLTQAQIIEVFNRCFAGTESTVLKGGADEPWYVPGTPAQLLCRADYAASALHEAAHWCLANTRQRQLPDFGFTYLPPPRSRSEQAKFFQLELKTQSLERILAMAASLPFRISADSFDPAHDELIDVFRAAVTSEEPATRVWMQTRAGTRARIFHDGLYRAAMALYETQEASVG